MKHSPEKQREYNRRYQQTEHGRLANREACRRAYAKSRLKRLNATTCTYHLKYNVSCPFTTPYICYLMRGSNSTVPFKRTTKLPDFNSPEYFCLGVKRKRL